MSDIKKPENPKVISKTWDYITNNFLVLFFFSIFISIFFYFYERIESAIYDNAGLLETLVLFCISLLAYIIPFAICAVKIHRNILLDEDLVGEIMNSFVFAKSLKYSLWAYVTLVMSYLPAIIFYFLFIFAENNKIAFLILCIISALIGIYALYRVSFYLPYLVTTNEERPMGFFSSFHKKTKGLTWRAIVAVFVYMLMFILAAVIIENLILQGFFGLYDITIVGDIIFTFFSLVIVAIVSFTYKSKSIE